MLHNCKAATLARLCARAVSCRVVLRCVMCRYNKGYSLLLYDNKDINAYMRTYYPGFVPCEWESAEGWDAYGMHGMLQWVQAEEAVRSVAWWYAPAAEDPGKRCSGQCLLSWSVS